MLKNVVLVLAYYHLMKGEVHTFRVALLIQQQLMAC
jgi:hypothetical protein